MVKDGGTVCTGLAAVSEWWIATQVIGRHLGQIALRPTLTRTAGRHSRTIFL